MKRSMSLLFRDEAAKHTPSSFRKFVAKKHKRDIAMQNANIGLLSFDDTSWAEYCYYNDGTVDVWAYNPRDGKPYKTNPKVLKENT